MVYVIPTTRGIISSHPAINGDFNVPAYLPDDLLFERHLEYCALTCYERRQIETAQEMLKYITPLYDVNSSFWKNFKKGPRKLIRKEKNILHQLEKRIKTKEIILFGKKINSQIGLASGPAPNSKFLDLYSYLGYDILTAKTVRLFDYIGHSLPNTINVYGDFYSGFKSSKNYTGSMTNYYGIGSKNYKEWVEDFLKFKKKMFADKLFILSVTATPTENMTNKIMVNQFIKLVEITKNEVGADACEINLSCPSVDSPEGIIYKNPDLVKQLLHEIRLRVGPSYPILIKIGYADKNDLYNLIYKVGSRISGVVGINAISQEISGGELKRAGICGRVLYEPSLKFLKNLIAIKKIHRDHFKIIGCGGIDPTTINKFQELDIDAYTIGSGAFNPFSARLCQEQMT